MDGGAYLIKTLSTPVRHATSWQKAVRAVSGEEDGPWASGAGCIAVALGRTLGPGSGAAACWVEASAFSRTGARGVGWKYLKRRCQSSGRRRGVATCQHEGPDVAAGHTCIVLGLGRRQRPRLHATAPRIRGPPSATTTDPKLSRRSRRSRLSRLTSGGAVDGLQRSTAGSGADLSTAGEQEGARPLLRT